jgi:hypothetical protein
VRLGFRTADVAPSPNVQLHALTVPSLSVLASVKLHDRAVHCEVKFATGSVFDAGGGGGGGALPNVTVASLEHLVVPALQIRKT